MTAAVRGTTPVGRNGRGRRGSASTEKAAAEGRRGEALRVEDMAMAAGWPPLFARSVMPALAVALGAVLPAFLEPVDEPGLAGLPGPPGRGAADGVQVGGLAALAPGLHGERG